MCHCVGFNLVDWEGLVAPSIHVEVDSPVVMQNKIANRVCTLDREGVVVPDIDEPGVLVGEEVTSRLVRPQLDRTVSEVQYSLTTDPRPNDILWWARYLPCIRSPNKLPCNSVASGPICLEPYPWRWFGGGFAVSYSACLFDPRHLRHQDQTRQLEARKALRSCAAE